MVTSDFESVIGLATPPRPARLGMTVLTTLIDKIVSGELPPNSALPTETGLCAAFGVSRTVIRESFKLLEEKGLVRVKQGQGTTVTPLEQWNLLDPLVLDAAIRHDETLEILDDLVDVRVAVEAELIRRAAVRMTDGQLAELHEALENLYRLIDRPVDYLVADYEYHDLVLRGSGNRLGRSIIRSVHPYARASSRYNGATSTKDIRASHVGHVEIYERLRARDPDGAVEAMRRHILDSWNERKQARLSQT